MKKLALVALTTSILTIGTAQAANNQNNSQYNNPNGVVQTQQNYDNNYTDYSKNPRYNNEGYKYHGKRHKHQQYHGYKGDEPRGWDGVGIPKYIPPGDNPKWYDNSLPTYTEDGLPRHKNVNKTKKQNYVNAQNKDNMNNNASHINNNTMNNANNNTMNNQNRTLNEIDRKNQSDQQALEKKTPDEQLGVQQPNTVQ